MKDKKRKEIIKKIVKELIKPYKKDKKAYNKLKGSAIHIFSEGRWWRN